MRFEPHESSTQDRFFEKHGSSLKGFEQGASSNPMVVLYTKLDSWVGRYILSKQGDNSVVFESPLGVAEHWVKEFCSIVPRATPGDFKEVSDCGSQVKRFAHDSAGLVQIADKKVRPKSKAKAQAKIQKMTRKAKKIVMMTSVMINLARKVCRLRRLKTCYVRKVRQA